jgi:hypothetical protein
MSTKRLVYLYESPWAGLIGRAVKCTLLAVVLVNVFPGCSSFRLATLTSFALPRHLPSR